MRIVAAAVVALLPFSAAHAAWQKTDCNTSRLTVPGQVECWQATPAPFITYVGGGGGRLAVPIQCVAEQGSTATQSAGTTGRVRYLMQQPGSDAHCLTSGGRNGPLSLMQHMNDITRSASGWANLSQDSNRFFATFTSPGLGNCTAFIAPGPPVSSPYRVSAFVPFTSDYYEYRLMGYLCRASGPPPNDADMQAYIRTVHIRTQ